jgi:hypothetical protein
MIVFLSSVIQAICSALRAHPPMAGQWPGSESYYRPIKQFRISVVFWIFGLSFAASSTAIADSSDPTQRYIKFTNELPITVWPVISAPEDANKDPASTKVDRIIINHGADGAGLKLGETVYVNIPKTGFYKAARLYLFTVNPLTLEQRVKDPNQVTLRDNPSLPNLCPNEPAGACWSGVSNAAYPKDAPAQLAEYTIISMNPATGDAFPDANNPAGLLMADIDVSYVDDIFLPVAMNLDDGGNTRYMGTTMDYQTFNQRTAGFLAKTSLAWQNYAAYTATNWPTNVFHDLLTQRPSHVPSGFNLVDEVLTGATSNLYLPVPPDGSSPLCKDWANCKYDTNGNDRGPTAKCCPPAAGAPAFACCGLGNAYLLANTSIVSGNYWNPSIDTSYARWSQWTNGNPCADISKINAWPSQNPKFDKQAFCNAFRTTVQYVWNTFQNSPVVQKNCSQYAGSASQTNYCILDNILGYKIVPLGQHDAGQRPESVQALMRNVPWGDGTGTLAYQFDKFLLFWAPYDSVFNLNPYTHMVHDKEGIGAPGSYSFSIDDKYGNFQNLAQGFIVDIGGSNALLNREPYDPYAQFRVNYAAGWDHASVCGHAVQLNGRAGSQIISFWNNGQKMPYCDVAFYANSSNTSAYAKWRLVEKITTPTDPWTGDQQKVIGFDFSSDANFSCANTSTADMVTNVCPPTKSNLTPALASGLPGGSEEVYMSLPIDQRPIVNLTLPPPR